MALEYLTKYPLACQMLVFCQECSPSMRALLHSWLGKEGEMGEEREKWEREKEREGGREEE